jgi:hypothetical protein
MESDRLRSGTETTVEDDDEELDMVGYKCEVSEGTLLERYVRSVRHILYQCSQTGHAQR